jgi:hypothetical protein
MFLRPSTSTIHIGVLQDSLSSLICLFSFVCTHLFLSLTTKAFQHRILAFPDPQQCISLSLSLSHFSPSALLPAQSVLATTTRIKREASESSALICLLRTMAAFDVSHPQRSSSRSYLRQTNSSTYRHPRLRRDRSRHRSRPDLPASARRMRLHPRVPQSPINLRHLRLQVLHSRLRSIRSPYLHPLLAVQPPGGRDARV